MRNCLHCNLQWISRKILSNASLFTQMFAYRKISRSDSSKGVVAEGGMRHIVPLRHPILNAFHLPIHVASPVAVVASFGCVVSCSQLVMIVAVNASSRVLQRNHSLSPSDHVFVSMASQSCTIAVTVLIA
eukprot:335587_1